MNNIIVKKEDLNIHSGRIELLEIIKQAVRIGRDLLKEEEEQINS